MSGYQSEIVKASKRSSTQIVLEAVRDLYAQEQIVTRETLACVTGLKMSIVDDRLSSLIDDEMVHRVQRGVFVPTELHPAARVMSKMLLPDGTVKIDIGDDVLTLTPREDRMLTQLMSGVMLQTAAIEVGHQSTKMAGELSSRLVRLERILAKLPLLEAIDNQQDAVSS